MALKIAGALAPDAAGVGGTLRHVVDIILPRVLAQERARFRVREVLAVPERRIRDAPVQDGKVARRIQRSVGRDINAGRARRDEQHKMRGVRDLRNGDVRKTMALDRERPRGHDNAFRHVRLRDKQRKRPARPQKRLHALRVTVVEMAVRKKEPAEV